MADPEPTNPSPSDRLPDWEAFYRDYRKPGYVEGFEVTTKLGGGAFGLVFRARKESIGKDYAIKFLKVEDADVRQAVLHELEQVKYFAQVDHPNLVQIEDRGEVDGIPFLLMQYAGSETLRDRLPAAGEVPSAETRDELLRYFLQACRGVAALHERSLVHFDLKPANVFIKGPVARVGDYGLSKLVTHSRGSLTMGRGTPYYMSPEMLQRRGDQRSDVYSLGIMLYEILCGQLPFRGDSEWEVLRKHEKEQPEWPAHLSETERAVMQRCMQKDPAQRYQSVHDLITALGAPAGVAAAAWDDVRSGAGTTATPPPPPPIAGGAADQKTTAADGEDPYTGFKDASREAYKHARKIAREAMVNAGGVSQKAAKKARELMREKMQMTRQDHLKRWRSWHAGWRQRRADWRRAYADKRAARHAAQAAGARRRGLPGWAVGLVVVPAGLLALMVVMWVSMAPSSGFSIQHEPNRQVTRASSGRASAWYTSPGLTTDRKDLLFYQWSVPTFLMSHVSSEEPKWVRRYLRDPDEAAIELQNHLVQLSTVAPWGREARSKAGDLPHFQILDKQAFDGDFDRLLQAPQYDPAIASRLLQAAPQSLAVAATRLRQLNFANPDEFEKARRLHELLRAGTGCDGIAFISDPRLSGRKINQLNRPLGAVWQWYLHEVGMTPETWNVFSRLRGR